MKKWEAERVKFERDRINDPEAADEFFAKDLKPILNRLTLHSETCEYTSFL